MILYQVREQIEDLIREFELFGSRMTVDRSLENGNTPAYQLGFIRFNDGAAIFQDSNETSDAHKSAPILTGCT